MKNDHGFNPAKLRRLQPPARALLLVAVLAFTSGVAFADAPVVHTESGLLEGTVNGSIVSFKGVPYAAPPLGELRWRAPRPPAHWDSTRNANDFGPSCVQSRAPQRVPAVSAAATTSEDCLSLSVWAPSPIAKGAPVMVWIHGGGNIQGSGSVTYTDGSGFARDGILLVTLNYRLGLLGFFAHPAIIGENGQRPVTNFGLLDQLAALQWVQRNIAAFGGDPNNVTLFGESAGAVDVLALMSTPASKGLFRRVIAESAPLWKAYPSLSEAESAAARAVTTLGLPGAQATVSQLRALSAESLMHETPVPGIGPIVDGSLLAKSPMLTLSSTDGPDIPLILGFNNNEGSLLGTDPDLTEPGSSQIDLAFWRSVYGASADSDKTLSQLLFRDAVFSEPARWLATHRSPHAPTYLYRFDYVLSLLRARRSGADHGSEIPYVFSSWNLPRISAEDQRVTAAVHSCWVAFARGGVLACNGVAPWPAYRSEGEWLMNFSDEITVQKQGDDAILDAIAAKRDTQSAPPTSAD